MKKNEDIVLNSGFNLVAMRAILSALAYNRCIFGNVLFMLKIVILLHKFIMTFTIRSEVAKKITLAIRFSNHGAKITGSNGHKHCNLMK